MNIVYATYIDNQDQIKYPIEFILSKFPEMIVYCSDEENYLYLESQGIKAKIIGHKINNPWDISIAQNKCIEDLLQSTDCDFIVWNQADILITELGKTIIKDFCIPENIGKSCALGLLHIKLFHNCGYSYYGVNVIGKECAKRFTGDGAYIGEGAADYCMANYNAATIDIGYLTIDQCRNHLVQHKKTWKSNDEIFNLPENEFVKLFVKRNNYQGLIKEYSEIFSLIIEMGLVEEYNKVKQICQ